MATSMTDFTAEREAMVDRQLRRRGITDQHILDAFLEVPREAFVDPEYAHLAYGDHPLPIEAGQTISQPYIVALTIQAAGIKRGDKVLEVGAGSGYAAAVISRIAGKVMGIERQHDLVEVARDRLKRLEYDNVEIVEGAVRRDRRCGERESCAQCFHRAARRGRANRHAGRLSGLGPGAGQGDEAGRRHAEEGEPGRRPVRSPDRGRRLERCLIYKLIHCRD
jgi:SAM-dependent methyltransferase